ncbi:hypothetical protein RRG08_046654 [Elysia crispata]|uniref:Uncharacterized protein n=1 Tax=Elysia crispata TaxID=231223 RepID=A0AAE1E3N2_9GAST|nr:hypothetical protein RRG08_046654 [Elysia crispata]
MQIYSCARGNHLCRSLWEYPVPFGERRASPVRHENLTYFLRTEDAHRVTMESNSRLGFLGERRGHLPFLHHRWTRNSVPDDGDGALHAAMARS